MPKPPSFLRQSIFSLGFFLLLANSVRLVVAQAPSTDPSTTLVPALQTIDAAYWAGGLPTGGPSVEGVSHTDCNRNSTRHPNPLGDGPDDTKCSAPYVCKKVTIHYWQMATQTPDYVSYRCELPRCPKSTAITMARVNQGSSCNVAQVAAEIDAGGKNKDIRLSLPSPSVVPFDPHRACCTTQETAGNFCDLAQCTGGAITPTNTGSVTTFQFNYKPDSQPNTTRAWGFGQNQAQVFFPTRLANQSAQVRVLVFIHGWNGSHHTVLPSPHTPFESGQPQYVQNLARALADVANRKNVVIFTPHFMAGDPTANNGYDFLTGLNLSTFYNTAVTAMQNDPRTRQFTVQDVIVGGHSGATCGTRQLTQAISSPLPNQRGVIAYDGCLGRTDGTGLNSGNFSPPGSETVLLNPDNGRDGMSPRTLTPMHQNWNLTVYQCPSYVDAGVKCLKNPAGTVTSFETNFGHEASVYNMTRYAFEAFFRDNPPAARP